MRGMKQLKYAAFMYSAFMAFVFAALLFSASSSRAHAQTNCDKKELGSPRATADLSLAAPHVDEVNWTSTTTLMIPKAWPRAGELLQAPGSNAFNSAYDCIVPDSYPYAISATLNQGNVVLKLVERGQINDGTLGMDGALGMLAPWAATVSHNEIHIAFSSNAFASVQGAAHINWETVTTTINGFRVVAPKPLPSSEPSPAKSVWYSHPTKPLSYISFTLIPPRLEQIVLGTYTGGPGRYVPLDAEVFLSSMAIIVFLGWRGRRRNIDIIDRKKDRTWDHTRLLCFLVASLSLIAIGIDFRLQFSTWFLSYQSIGTLVIATFGVAFMWHLGGQPSRWPSRFLAIVLFALSVLGQNGLLIGGLPFLFLCWIIILSGIDMLFRPIDDHPRRLMLLAGLLGLLSFGLQLGTGSSPYYLFPGYAVGRISGCIIVFGMLMLIAKAHREPKLLLGSSDRLLFAAAVAYAMLFAGPRWYLGVYVNIVSTFAFAATWIVVSVGWNHSLVKPASDSLKDKTRCQLQDIQEYLINAEMQLDELTKDLKAYEGVPLTNQQVERRDHLEKEATRLRQWPTLENRRRLRLREQGKQPFPEPAGPADMALALGPGCEPMQNAKRAFRPAVALVFVPVLYFAGRESFVSSQFSPTPLSPYFRFITNLCVELTFWLFPLLALAVIWSSLAGRRGSGRAIQIWLCVSLPLIIHSFINNALNQSATLTPILRCAVLLVALLSLGLWLDLSTLRLYRPRVTSFRSFQRYVRLNRVVAILTLLVPLITAGLAIWSQIANGVLHQQVSPAQVSNQAPPSPPP
jgi:hypothetical protein